MDWILIKGVRPYDGRYELDIERDFSTREWGWIKRFAGYLPLDVEKGLAGGDPELFATLAVIVLRRADKITAAEAAAVFDAIVDSPFGTTIGFESDSADEPAEDGDAGPPASNSNGSASISGAESATKSVSSTSPPSDYGTLDSDFSA